MATHGLKNWVEKLQSQNMPVLGDVIVELNKITGTEDADVNQLSEVILRDPNLTSHVLRIANSVQYNYSRAHVSTVSRAIVQIGLKGVRAICISLLVIDSLLKGKPKERLLQLIAQGFHAGTQARKLLESNGDQEWGEEVFIAGLLFNLGEMAFWASEDVKESNNNLMSDNPRIRRAAMEEVLGTSFKSITKELSKHWKLGETLEQALDPPETPNNKVKAVILGERLSRSALYGWDSPQVKKVIGEVMDFNQRSMDDALMQVKAGGDAAAKVALDYGVSEACPLIPNSLKEVVLSDSKPAAKILKGDAAVQLSILRDLVNATNEGLDVNTIFQMVLEGLHRGIGLERVAIAFIKQHRLSAKYVLGEGTDHWRNSFNFDVGPYSDSIFCHAIERTGSFWFTAEKIKKESHLVPGDVSTIIGKFPSFVHLIEIEKRKVAIFYADRWNFGGNLTNDQFESFKHFCNQAQMSLTLLSDKSGKR